MSMPVLRPYGLDSEVGDPIPAATGAISPFAPLTLSGDAAVVAAPPPGQVLHSPFTEAAAAVGGHDLEADATGALLAELDDAEFAEALEALEDEAAARHLRSVGTWSSDSEAPVLATADTAQWLAELAEEADRVLGALAEHFGDRPADSLQEGEIEAVAGEPDSFTNPLTAQQLFLGGLIKKAKKLAKGVGKLAKKGVAFVGKLALGPLFGILRKLVRPLLRKVLNSAIGRLPASVRPLATQLAAKLQGTPAQTPDASLAEEFDRDVTAFLAAPNEDAATMPEDTTYEAPELDDARARLVRELAEADPGVPPTAQLEQFIPAVMAAMPLIRMGVKVIGRDRVVGGIAGPLSRLISGMVGADAAKLLSRHIAGTGLGLLGLEAGVDGALGSEALVAATEDTVRHVMTLPPASMENELLLETEVQDAFAEAAARHLPAAMLRAELAERELDTESGVWVMMPRATRPCFRYKKYSRVIPVRITRPMARSVVLSGGDTLERRLLESGVQAWPVDGEVELYELLPGGMPGHMSAFESGDSDAAAQEFEELTQTAATMLAGNPRFAQVGRFGGIGRRRRPGTRYFRLRHRGRALRRGRGRGFAWLRATEQLFFRDLPTFSVAGVLSQVRPFDRTNRRNSYWRMFGLDLAHAVPALWAGSGPLADWKSLTGPVNQDFRQKWSEFLRQVWIGVENRDNQSGANPADASYIALLARALKDLLGNRRRGGAIAREEFAYVTMLNWLHLTVDTDTPLVIDLQAQASSAADRLGALGQKVGIAPALRSRELFDLAEPMSTLLRGVELGLFDSEDTATALFTEGSNIFRDVLDTINNWQSATGERVKESPARQQLVGGQPLRVPVPAAPPATASAPLNGAALTHSVNGRNG